VGSINGRILGSRSDEWPNFSVSYSAAKEYSEIYKTVISAVFPMALF
jgi:hypothetical protein